MEVLILKSILRKHRIQAYFRSKEEKIGGAVFVRTQTTNRISLKLACMSKTAAINWKAMGTMWA